MRETFALCCIIATATILRLVIGAVFFGFHTGDDVEILSAAFRAAFDLQYSPWEIRNLLQSNFVIAPVIKLAALAGIQETRTLIWIATFPFVLLASLNIFLVYSLASRWFGGSKSALLASFLYAFHWLPLGYGATVYPRTASTTCILAGTLLCSYTRDSKWWRPCLAGMILAIAFAIRYSEIIFVFPLLVLLWKTKDNRALVKDVSAFALGLLIGIVLFVGLVDHLTWGKPFASLLAFAKFTLLEKQSSSLVVEQPVYWYLLYLPKWLPLTLVPFFFLAQRVRTSNFAWWFIVLPLLLLSFIHHKELRYLQGLIPYFCLVASAGAVAFWQSGWRRTTALLLILSVLWGFTGLRFHRRKSMSAVLAAQALAKDPSLDSVGLSQSWAYGKRLYLGNRMNIVEVPTEPTSSDIDSLPSNLDALGLYEKDIKKSPEVSQLLQKNDFQAMQTWKWDKSKAVSVYKKISPNNSTNRVP